MYNKAKAEQEWLRWKEAEEQQLRKLGMDEESIQKLRQYDWEAFNQERRYLQRWSEWLPCADQIAVQDIELPVESPDSLLDSIENEKQLQVLSEKDKLTIEMLFLWLEKYSAEEIFQKLGVSAYTYYNRIYYNRIKRLKEKIRKILSSD